MSLASSGAEANSFDVLTMGRVGVDVYPQQIGVGLEDVTSFAKYLGGSAGNVAVAAARHGRRVALVSGVGTDPFGRFVRRALRGFGVDDAFVVDVDDLPTPVTFCEIFPPDHFPIYFYRRPSAPDLQVRPEHLDADAVRRAGIFWATVTGLCQEPSRTTTLQALALRGRADHTVLDLDWRPMFWESAQAAEPLIRAALDRATVAVGNLDECEVAVGERDPERAAQRLRALGIRLAVVKLGGDGVFALDDSGAHHCPATPVEVVNGLGAGDAFGGALCHGLLAGWDTGRILRFANAAGAWVAARLACADAMPTAAEVEDWLSSREPVMLRP
ncbi:MAG TPA: 5-dehydro-2-deoxygluconokinase [Sporichthyaceae bacterium]|jgi:5-dehydro-2-deoxygluconokinase|nr:5-dehydro-2-deoxygluconokinase [Sporichthyaceae bacterium]